MSSIEASDSNARWDAYEDLPALACVISRIGGIVFANGRLRQTFRVAPSDAQPLAAERLVHADDRPTMRAALLAAGDADVAFDVECRMRGRKGSYRWYRVALRRAGDDLPGGVLAVLTDIDGERRYGQYLKLLAEVGAQLALASDIDAALTSTARLALPLVCDWFIVYRPDAAGRFRPRIVEHLDPGQRALAVELLETYGTAGGKLLEGVIETSEAVILPDITPELRRSMAVDERHLDLMRRIDARSMILVPVVGRQQMWAIVQLVVGPESSRLLDDADLRFAREFANRAAIALDGLALIASEQRAARDLRFLADVGEAMGASLDLVSRLELFVNAVVPRLADWATLNLTTDDGGIDTVAIAHRDRGMDAIIERLRGPFYGTVETHPGTPLSLRTGHSRLLEGIDDAFLERHVRPELRDVVATLGARTVFVVPLKAQGVIYGTVSAVRADEGRPFSTDDMWLIEELARRAAVAIANARLFERNTNVSDAFQQASLPTTLPQTVGLDFSAFYAPGKSEAMIGGDWFDAFRLADGRIVLSIGDVSGSGLQAAVVMGSVRQVIRGAAQLQPEPGVILDATDRALRSEYPESYVTAFVGILDPIAMRVAYASAGHPPPFMRRADGSIVQLEGTGLLLGLREGDESPGTTIPFEDGALFVLYTDGLTESTRDVIEGERAVFEALADPAVVEADDIARALHDRVLVDGAVDDVAILAVAVRGAVRWRFDCTDPLVSHATLEAVVAHLRATCEPEGDFHAAATVFLELVGNAVRYAPGPIDVAIDWDEDAPVLHVIDDGPGFRSVARRRPSDPLAETGRGLFLIGSYARRFEIAQRRGRGSHARATLRLHRLR